ncbi:hypothetical protein KC19_11G072900 [Ceratodon purpureus]|uniref:Uncharacterized protein n=1 Tax=Ceratodon purpureus TaxID=3225 RepID=A0A8T0GBY5_CERPU|nr:hypothetical protein KC19_11G072900 [Ceratodon purpureus]
MRVRHSCYGSSSKIQHFFLSPDWGTEVIVSTNSLLFWTHPADDAPTCSNLHLSGLLTQLEMLSRPHPFTAILTLQSSYYNPPLISIPNISHTNLLTLPKYSPQFGQRISCRPNYRPSSQS